MKNIIVFFLYFISILLSACDNFLDKNSSNTLAIPSSFSDLQKLLDNEFDVNQFYPAQLEASTDNYYLTDQGFAGLRDIYQSMYIWEDNGMNEANWAQPYKAITIANVVLESLERIKNEKIDLRNKLEGEALFLRSVAYFYLAQVFCDHYHVDDSSDRLGLVLRLDSDVNIKNERSTLLDTYKQILKDLEKAFLLLPTNSEYLTRPNKIVAASMLGRIYLTIGKYDKAEEMIDLVLKADVKLLDFNSIDIKAQYPFSLSNNHELLYIAVSGSAAYNTLNSNAFIPEDLYNLYEDIDLRKHVYFTESVAGIKFKGFYHGVRVGYFAGIAVDEVYLIKAECLIRRNELELGAKYMNTLLKNRYEEGTYKDIWFNNSQDGLEKILLERRKEFVFRGLRWIDLRRMNIYPEYKTTLQRVINGDAGEKKFLLEPESKNYTFLIPWSAVNIGGYKQNSR